MSTLAEVFVDIKANLAPLKTGLAQANQAVSSGVGGLKNLLGGLGITPAALGIVGGIAAISFAVKKAMDAENALDSLGDKLSSTGQNVDGNLAKFTKLGEAFQASSTTTKQQVNDLILQGMQMGLNADQAQKFTTAAIGLSQATGIDTKTALEGVIKNANGMKSSLDKSIPAIAAATTQAEKMAVITKLAGQGLGMMTPDTTADKMTMIQNALTSLYEKLGGLFLPIVNVVLEKVISFTDWLTQLTMTAMEFGLQGGASLGLFGEATVGMGNLFDTVFSAIGDAIAFVLKTVLKMPIFFDLVGTAIAAGWDYMIEYIRVFGINAWNIVQWFCKNWKDIFYTSFDYVSTIAINLGENIRSVWQSVWDFITGKGWKAPNFKPLTEGFVNTVKEMPEIVKAQNLGYGDVFDQILDKADEVDKKWEQTWKKNKPMSAQEGKDYIGGVMEGGLDPIQNIKDDQKKKGKSNAGQFTGVAEVWKTMQTAILKGQDDKGLQSNIRQEKSLEKIERHLQSIDGKKGLELTN